MEEDDERGEPPRKRCKTESSEANVPDEGAVYLINLLPYELYTKIFKMLNFKDRLQCRLVCKRWNAILLTEPFISNIRYNFSHCFGLPLSIHRGHRYMEACVHCVFHDCGSYPDRETQQEMADMIRNVKSSDDEPGPSYRVTASGPTSEQYLFSGELPLKTLEIKASFDRMRRFLGDRLQAMKNLQELRLVVMSRALGDEPVETAPVWKITHETLPSLAWELYSNTHLYEIKLPALEKLRLEIASDCDLDVVMNYSCQLVELTVWFYFDRAMEQTLTVPFPKLKKLVAKHFEEENHSPEPNTRVDNMSAERFVRSAPVLEDVYLDSSKVTYRLFRAICLFGVDTVKRLSVRDVIFPRSLFLFIVELKNLEFLKLKNCILEEGSRLRGVDFPRLQHLVLTSSGTCFRLDASFAHIRRFKYTMDKQLSRLCRNMVMLEDLEVKLRTTAPVAEHIREHFHSLASLMSLRTLRLNGMRTNTRPWAFCKPMPLVERLVLRKCHLLRGNFKDMRKLFPNLKMLELDGTCIAYKQLPRGVKPMVHLQRRLKQFLPGCWVKVNSTSMAEPVSTVLKMENESEWNLHVIRTAGIKLTRPYVKGA
uniref:F-box domain-containing protein n=1 Tax=Anopheles culicifacies TaxID=139723 RepID=A0A182M390_9DIPT